MRPSLLSKVRFMVRPGWIALAAVVALFAYLCFSILAPWQLGKNSSTSERNDQISRALETDPVGASTLLSDGSVSADDEWRRVSITGTYLPNSDVLVRLRTVDDTPSYEVLTPLRDDDGTVLVVNRGYVLPTEGNQPPPLPAPPTEPVTLDGQLRVSEIAASGRDPITGPGVPQVYSITASQVGQLTGTTPIDGYLQLPEGQPGGLGTIALPRLDAGPYLSYGLQWLAFGIMAPLGLAYFVRAELRERRKVAHAGTEEEPDVDDTVDPVVHDDLDALLKPRRTLRRKGKASPEPMSETQARLTDRYGKQR